MIASRRQLLLWPALILATGYSAPCFAQPVFTCTGANRDSFYEGRVIYGSNRVHDEDYGVWAVNAPGLYESVYVPQVTYVLRMDNATRTRVVAAECIWASVPPGATCPWDDEPGSVWMTPNIAATFNPDTFMWASASAGGEPQHPLGADAPRMIDGWWVIPLTFRLDQSDRYWHWLGEPADWWDHPEWFAELPVWLGVPNTDSATLRVVLSETHADFTLEIHAEPPLHADIDRDGAVGVTDVFMFLAEWFRGGLAGDWDASGSVAAPDIFAFLSEWFDEVE